MDLKWILIGALAYAMLTKKKDGTSSTIKAPTQEEIVAAANKQAQAALEQARQILETI